MNEINRVLVKSQAKKILSEKVFVLFIVSIIAILLTNGLSIYGSITQSADTIMNDGFGTQDENSLDDYNDYYNYFDEFSEDGSTGDNPIENFGNASPQSYKPVSNVDATVKATPMSLFAVSDAVTSLSGVLSILFAPLLVTLCGFYVALIRRNPEEELKLGTGISNLFMNSFNGTFLKKLIVYVLRNLFTVLWSILFIIPGIVYNYSSYFAYQIMNDYPNLKPSEALKLSKKITKGNRSELFWLDLSFIGWFILSGITCGIASIYVIPYYNTTQALYYENFRLRAIQEGRVREDDFLSAEELAQKYNGGAGSTTYYAPNTNEQYAQQGTYYNPDTAYQNNSQQDNNYYYQPSQAQPESAPQQDYSYAQPQGDGVGGEYTESTPQSAPESTEHHAPESTEYYTPESPVQPQQSSDTYYQPPQDNSFDGNDSSNI